MLAFVTDELAAAQLVMLTTEFFVLLSDSALKCKILKFGVHFLQGNSDVSFFQAHGKTENIFLSSLNKLAQNLPFESFHLFYF